MTKLYKAALLAALGLASVTAAQASNNMLLGFSDFAGPSSAQNDYVIDLGAASLFTTSASLNLSSLFNASTFTTAFGTDSGYLHNVAVGVVEGGPAATKVNDTRTLFQTASGTPQVIIPSTLQTAAADAAGVAIGNYVSTTTGGWSLQVAPSSGNLGGSTVASTTGTQPLQNLSSGVIFEDLYENIETKTGNFTYANSGWSKIGTFDINVNTGSVTFDGVASAVPEPASYGLLAAAGLLIVSLRNKLSRNQA